MLGIPGKIRPEAGLGPPWLAVVIGKIHFRSVTQMQERTMHTFHQLTAADGAWMSGMLDVFAEAFEDPEIYAARRPSAAYLQRLLGGDSFIGLVARAGEQVIGGLAAYVLQKFEQERAEIYIYDLAVMAAHRRQGVATGLIRRLQEIGAERGAWVVFVQADPPDTPAIRLYEKLGVREEVLHFDIPVRRPPH